MEWVNPYTTPDFPRFILQGSDAEEGFARTHARFTNVLGCLVWGYIEEAPSPLYL